MEPRVTLVTLGVRDLAQSLRFYRDGLGWPMSSAGGDDVAFFNTGGAVIALYARQLLAEDASLPLDAASADAFPGFALAHNVASKDLVDEVLAAAVDAGARLVKPAVDVFWGGYSGYFADPDGFLWEVAWNPGWPLRPDGTVMLPE